MNGWIKGAAPPNVWLGVSAGYQHTIDKRVPLLLDVPAAIHFISIEPLLEKVDISPYLGAADGKLGWVIVGGESGNETGNYLYRPCELDWIDTVVAQCDLAGTQVWVKQLGTHLQKKLGLKARHGTDVNEWPLPLQVQHFPI